MNAPLIKPRLRGVAAVAALLVLSAQPALGQTARPPIKTDRAKPRRELSSATGQRGVAATKHNLSVTGPGKVTAQTESRICIFCHISHGMRWQKYNRPESTATIRSYRSAAMKSKPSDAPSGATRVCLSCHDGTIAPGKTLRSGTIQMRRLSRSGAEQSSALLGTDLRTSHPVSFEPAVSGTVRVPDANSAVKLGANGRIECTSCHDPHLDTAADPVEGDFLVESDQRSALCLECHALEDWKTAPSAHQSSLKVYDARNGAHTGYETVADNGCSSCHRQHGAATTSYLLKKPPGEVCLDCHNGTVADTDIAAELNKRYTHPILSLDQTVHDAAEGPNNAEHRLPETNAAAPRHVVCSDCHNPHAAFDRDAVAPLVPGALLGVSGIDRSGARIERAENEYEICFKCHGDSANKPRRDHDNPTETVRRALPDDNLRLRFEPTAPSYHPVVQQGRNKDVPSLIAPLHENSLIYCTDCHSSNEPRLQRVAEPVVQSHQTTRRRASRGPHGSIYPHILERNYVTDDFTPETPDSYGLCYKCHDRDVLMSERSSFPLHRSHVRDDHAPCSACHDAHGVSSTQGNETNNAHLINFDISIVSRNTKGIRRYATTGKAAGVCSLTCHRHDHDNEGYRGGDGIKPPRVDRGVRKNLTPNKTLER